MSTVSIYDRAGKATHTGTLTATQTEQARTLADAIRDAQHKTGLTIYEVLGTSADVPPKLEDILAGDLPMGAVHYGPGLPNNPNIDPIPSEGHPGGRYINPSIARLRAINALGYYAEAAYTLGLIPSLTPTGSSFWGMGHWPAPAWWPSLAVRLRWPRRLPP